MKLTRKQLRRIIKEAIDSFTMTPNLTKRSLHHDVQQEPIAPEFGVPQSEYTDKISDMRATGNIETARSADLLAKAINPVDYEMTSPPRSGEDIRGYADAKAIYDKTIDRPYDDQGRYQDAEDIDYLSTDISPNWGELGEYLEFSRHPEHGTAHDTILYKLYNDLAQRDVDPARAIYKLQDYMVKSDPDADPDDASTGAIKEYQEDRQKLSDDIIKSVDWTVFDLKVNLKHHLDRYHNN